MTAPGWPVVLQSGSVRLRPLRASDATAWRALRARNATWLRRWDATVPPESGERPGSFGRMARRMLRSARGGTSYPFALEVEDRLAGQLTVSNIVRGSAQYCSIGYWLGQEYAGRGIMPRAVAMAIDHCFTAGGLHRVEIAIRPENSNSLRVVEKLQIPEVGFAAHYLHIDGEWRDHRLYGLTVEQWPAGGLVAWLDRETPPDSH